MREILFKAKRLDNGEWVEGFFVNAIEEYSGGVRTAEIITLDAERMYSGEYTCWKTHIVDINTLCQYTGLTDSTKWKELTKEEQSDFLSKWNYEKNRKNTVDDWKGRQIWENDIIEEGCNGLITKVVWNNHSACFRLDGLGDSYKCDDSSIEWEVIGNIFDNSELLKEGD